MYLSKIKVVISAAVFISCTSTSSTITVLGTLPKKLSEASAAEVTEKSGRIWTLEDSGNKPELYALDNTGKITQTLAITNADNNDWEDLTSDKQGNLYIGDFGNNDNLRTNLSIYRINETDLNKTAAAYSQKTEFYYPEQKAFPPKKSKLFYDAESFFLYKDNFYLFTKNRSSKSDGSSLLYRIPNKPGRYAAQLIGQFITCSEFRHCAVTSADISPDGTKMVLLSGSKVWLFEQFKNDNFVGGKVRKIELNHFSQKEGICFVGNSKLYITDERVKKVGGKLYELKI